MGKSRARTRIGQAMADGRGSAAVEFSLVGGLLILMLFSLLDVGLLLNTKMLLTQAARAGVRQAIIDGGASARAYRAVEDQLSLAGLTGGGTEVSISPRTASYGTVVRVALAHDYSLKTPLALAVGYRRVRLAVTLIGRSEKLSGGLPR